MTFRATLHQLLDKLAWLDCNPASQLIDSVIATSVSQLLIFSALLLYIGVSLAFLCCNKPRGHKPSCPTAYFISIKLKIANWTDDNSWHRNGRTHAIWLPFAGKDWLRPKAWYWWYGGRRDQIRRFGLLHHACVHGPVVVLPGAWRQNFSPGTTEEKGKS